MCDGLGAGYPGSAGDSTFQGRVERCVEDVPGDGLHMRISSSEQGLASRDRVVVTQRQGFAVAGREGGRLVTFDRRLAAHDPTGRVVQVIASLLE